MNFLPSLRFEKFSPNLFFLLLFFSFSTTANAADRYVRPGGAGSKNGTDWNNAWDTSSADLTQLSPGDTLWLAGGNYSSGIALTGNGSAAGNIYIRRVTAADAGPRSKAGWNTNFDSQVIINLPADSSAFNGGYPHTGGSYLVIDGRVDSGILVNQPTPSPSTRGSLLNIYNGSVALPRHDLTMQYVEFNGPGVADYCADDYAIFVVDWHAGSTAFNDHVTISHCNVHGSLGAGYYAAVHNLTIENSRFSNFGASETGPCPESKKAHSQVFWLNVVPNFTFRYNQVSNWQLYIFSLQQTYSDIYIYGNVFGPPRTSAQNPISYSTTVFWACFQPGENSTTPLGPLHFYNNTVVDIAVNDSSGRSKPWVSGSEAKNNIYWNSAWGSYSGFSDGYNWSTSPPGDIDYEFINSGSNVTCTGSSCIKNGANPFVNYAGQDYHITGTTGSTYPRNRGKALAAGFNLDKDGNTRGADGSWDIGAFEFSAGGAGPSPTIPGNLRIGN